MRRLLDTHIFLWAVAGSRLLKPATRRFIESADEVYVSAASIWEVAIKARLGKIETDPANSLLPSAPAGSPNCRYGHRTLPA